MSEYPLSNCTFYPPYNPSHFNRIPRIFSVSLRDSLLFDFGAMLMSKDTHWIFGLDYLEQCSVEGAAAIEVFLSKIVIQNERQAMKVLNVARNSGFTEVGKWLHHCSLNVPLNIDAT